MPPGGVTGQDPGDGDAGQSSRLAAVGALGHARSMRKVILGVFGVVLVEFAIAPLGGRVFDYVFPESAGFRSMTIDIPFYHLGYGSVFAVGAAIGYGVALWKYRENRTESGSFDVKNEEINPLDRIYSNARLSLEEMRPVSNNAIAGKRFLDCELVGPSTIIFERCHLHVEGDYPFNDCVFIRVRRQLPIYIYRSALHFQECNFVNTRFHRCIIAVPEGDDLAEKLKNAPVWLNPESE